MGLFSFLTGTKDDAKSEPPKAAATPANAPSAPQPPASQPPTAPQSATAPQPPTASQPATAQQRESAPPPHPAPDALSHAASAPEAPPTSASEPPSHSTFQPPDAWNLDALTKAPPEPSSEKGEVGEIDRAVTAELQPQIVATLKTVFDPEIPVDIYELGLIYDIIADADRRVLIKMTLTSPACPSAQQLPSEVRWKAKAVPGVSDAFVEIVWEPPWDKDRMSEAAKLQLGMF